MNDLRTQHTRSRRLTAGLLAAGLLLALLGGFLAGLGASRWPAFGRPVAASSEAGPPQPAPEYALLREIKGLIEGEYLRPETVDEQTLVYGAARGMVQALGDPNSVYETPSERELASSRWTGRYDGVGMYADQRDGEMVVTAPIEGGPAQKAGVQAGDVVLEVDGQSVSRLTLNEQTRLIRGPRGSTVTLTVRRAGAATLLQIPIVRDQVRIISARGRMLDNGLGVLRVSQFTESTAGELRTALEDLLARQPVGLLLDLRGNAGGLLEPAVQATGLFLGGGPVVLERHADGEEKRYVAPDGPASTSLPLVVLVDRGSASASEVMAAALRDQGRAELLGERTYGKNTVQYIHQLSEGSGLRITVAQWHSPSGQPIPATGLDPDWLIARPADTPADQDPVLEQAAQHLLARIQSTPGQTPSQPAAGAHGPDSTPPGRAT
jgi:carboxyl-terminal processing protease